MRFVIIYKNKEETRKDIEVALLKAISEGHNFEELPIRAETFYTLLWWPSEYQIGKLSFNIQIEELEYKDGALTTLRKRIIDE